MRYFFDTQHHGLTIDDEGIELTSPTEVEEYAIRVLAELAPTLVSTNECSVTVRDEDGARIMDASLQLIVKHHLHLH